ncbi:MAG: AAA family ATPase [Clostridia bacterium]|nr:AAA family ATPase [Clostridia bacterium]
MKKKLVLVGAPPACGKNYVSKLICEEIEHITYLDKDDLSALIRCCFTLCDEELNMDGDFYIKNLRPSEYKTLFNLAFSALRFGELVLVNAPFVREVRDMEYMHALKERVKAMDAELVLIWVVAPINVCYERMKNRNSNRDSLKLGNWSEYVKTIDYSIPTPLEENGVVDKLIVFDNANDNTARKSLRETVKRLKE